LSNFDIYLERVQESRNYIYDESQQWENLKREAGQIYVGLNMLLAAAGLIGVAVDQEMQHRNVEQRFKRDALEYVREYKKEGIIKADNTLDKVKIKELDPNRANVILDKLKKVLNRIPEEINVKSDEFQEIVNDTSKKAKEQNERVKKEQKEEAQRRLKENPNRRLYGGNSL
jgi:hypothetical protein